MNSTSIGWTHRPETGGAFGGFTWNPIRARRLDGKAATSTRDHGTFCTKISPGCKKCYASLINVRFGTGLPFEAEHLEEHEFYIDEDELQAPLRRKKPATIFCGDMCDMFHPSIPFEMLYRVYAVIGLCQHHTFQMLTKRSARMREFKILLGKSIKPLEQAALAMGYSFWFKFGGEDYSLLPFPFPNEWAGVSVENQVYANERTGDLLETPAAVRYLSIEPLLGRVDLTSLDGGEGYRYNALFAGAPFGYTNGARINWAIAGGESGEDARVLEIDWLQSLEAQCADAGVAFYMKQDSGRFPSRQGRIPNRLWKVKNFPRLTTCSPKRTTL